MNVFLVPLGPLEAVSYELYTEDADEPEDTPIEEPLPAAFFARLWFRLSPVRLFARLKIKFTQMLAAAEQERRRDAVSRAGEGWVARMKSRAMRWVAEAIAEQRLLWNLRKVETACLLYPTDMEQGAAVDVLRKQLATDFDKHRLWLAIDSVLLVVSAALILVPGPNVAGYYFAFRTVGHYFSVRGARNGLNFVTWSYEASPLLAELRGLALLDPAVRLERVEQVATALELDHFATFFQRVSLRTP
ncbi:MAG TPA: hypothetical protein VNJ03_01115 [Vicinamibacterales bacterium]|nr:hypothetical protein [Vicinamibacterales bacterium]